jgi:hypothetical protein
MDRQFDALYAKTGRASDAPASRELLASLGPLPARTGCVLSRARMAWSNWRSGRAIEHRRDRDLHRKDLLEVASGGLQIAIILASISVVVDLPLLMWGSVLLGLVSALYGLYGGLSPL